MKKLSLLLLLLNSFTLCYTQSLTLDAEKATVSFTYVSEKVSGSIKGIKATLIFDINNLAKSSISGTAEVKTLSTGIKKRDQHLCSADYFNAPKYPLMSYKSSSIEKIAEGYKMTGALTIAGTENKVEFIFTYTNSAFEGSGVIYMNDFKVMTKKERENSKVILHVLFPVI
jgi:polyisoprenoid-binding protein YceI